MHSEELAKVVTDNARYKNVRLQFANPLPDYLYEPFILVAIFDDEGDKVCITGDSGKKYSLEIPSSNTQLVHHFIVQTIEISFKLPEVPNLLDLTIPHDYDSELGGGSDL